MTISVTQPKLTPEDVKKLKEAETKANVAMLLPPKGRRLYYDLTMK